MAEGTLASAVVLPEQDNLPPSPDAGLKRRNSVVEADSESKRRRLSSHQDHTGDRSPAERKQSSPDGAERKPERRPGRGGREEERKRGQRLFGALLGTLSQSSNSAAQKRRADIERRQQDKLKLQDEEYGELKKKRREERIAIRKKEQRLYEEESMRTRHSNLLAMSRFLKTKTEPVLYYKPWQLRPGDEAIIREQVEEAEATVSREVAEFEARYPAHEDESLKKQDGVTQEEDRDQAPEPEAELKEDKDTTHEADTVVAETNHNRDSEAAPPDATATNNNNIPINNDHADVHRGAEDDGGEVVEDKEDTVIY
ncbi:pinin/SDK/memA/ protein conserved region-domain-containing protein [Aspergillus pseudotamarii]|uniref:Pinin/SDK/memA/ protein conserved region-domain-containing protein n=1 Tax=Aspergillus pseudotamarii TaxID=132259 RepID=A0A5N6SI54_ASPPS|nr:pinin/SDK/memA/ protein conserved region-domain-containing protein [Aspergillus pseudotamarii]KAE8134388.1 pinin/SDK/memA/ protein conserved region-domain-containing protein [Aspergillus pseudotamarii]